VDVIVRKEDEYRLSEFERRCHVEFTGFKLWLVSKEDLILSKLIWAKGSHSELQLRDIKNLLVTKPDDAYLKRWAEKLGVLNLLEEAVYE
jgi:hypothetical protein